MIGSVAARIIAISRGSYDPFMSDADRLHWDDRHAELGLAPIGRGCSPPELAAFEPLFPTHGLALELACGRGEGALWLASRGMSVHAVDVSPVAIELARELAERSGFADRCKFEVRDLDGGLPDTPPVALLLCQCFRDPRLDRALVARLAPGGLLAMVVLSEVGGEPGRFRAKPGELREAFHDLDILASAEADGIAWIVARQREGT
jgi:SAM-dependent methyltransferase